MEELTPRQLTSIVKELQEQIDAERYFNFYNHWAFLAALITNQFTRIINLFVKRKGKFIKTTDFVSKELIKKYSAMKGMAVSKIDRDEYIREAKAKGLIGPWSVGGEKEC